MARAPRPLLSSLPRPRARLVVALAALLVAAASPAARSAPAPAAPDFEVVGQDARFDWGGNTAPGLQRVGEALGQDLLRAEIATTTEDLVLRISTTVMPSQYVGLGQWPSLSRFMWGLSVDGSYVLVDATLRAGADCHAGCRTAAVSVRSECTADEFGVVSCRKVHRTTGSFALGPPSTLTIAVAREVLGVQPGSVVGPGRSAFEELFDGNLIAVPVIGGYSDALMPADAMETGLFHVEDEPALSGP